MDKELSEEGLYALARGVIGERCAQLEGAFRTGPGGLLAFSDDPLARAMQKEAGKDVPTLTEREHVGMLALASLEWLFKVRKQPWLHPYSTTPPEIGAERCTRHVRGLLRYLEPKDAVMAWRFAEAPEALMAQQDQQKSLPADTSPTAAVSSTSTTEHGPKVAGAGSRGGRRDLMTAAIEAAQRACTDPTDAVQVWLELRSMAERRVQPLRGTTEDGIQWVDSSDAPKTLKIGSLRDRIRRASTR